jgi:NADPH:quinone reductase-like Zn-dependent oxidoreductase
MKKDGSPKKVLRIHEVAVPVPLPGHIAIKVKGAGFVLVKQLWQARKIFHVYPTADTIQTTKPHEERCMEQIERSVRGRTRGHESNR